jgi:acyl carrier protein
MSKFLNDIADLLEVSGVNREDKLAGFAAWDSLTILSIIAYLDETYSINVSAKEINDAETIQGLMELAASKRGSTVDEL